MPDLDFNVVPHEAAYKAAELLALVADSVPEDSPLRRKVDELRAETRVVANDLRRAAG